MKTVLTTIILGMLSVPALACDVDGKTGFLPENDLKISSTAKFRNDMTEERFNEIIDIADKFYKPIVKEKGGKLKDHLLPGLSTDGVPKNLKNTIYPFKFNDFSSLEKICSNNEIGVIKM